MFTAYLNKGKNKGKPSNVKEYRLGADYIDVRFYWKSCHLSLQLYKNRTSTCRRNEKVSYSR